MTDSVAASGAHACAMPIAWEEVVTLVRRQMRSFVGGGRDLEDLTQTALERIYRTADRFKGRSEVATYPYRVCSRVALNHWRWYRRPLRASRSSNVVRRKSRRKSHGP